MIPVAESAEVLLYHSTGFIITMYPTMKGTLYTQYLYQMVAIHTFLLDKRNSDLHCRASKKNSQDSHAIVD